MPSILDDGASWLAGQLADHVSHDVYFGSAGGPPFNRGPIPGTPQKLVSEVIKDGMPTVAVVWDWTFETAALRAAVPWDLISGQRFEDRTTRMKFEILPPNANLPNSEQLDTGGKLTVVHTKKV